MTYFAIKNLRASDVYTFSDPQAECAASKTKEPPGLIDKETRRKWLASEKSDACIFSIWEGVNPEQRINAKAGNPVFRMHGLVTDYDAPSPGTIPQIKANIEQILSATPALIPQWVVISPSGNMRLVWEFNEPFNVGDAPDIFLPHFIDEMRKLLKLDLLLAGLDEGALKKTSTYYDIGGTWDRFNPDALNLDEAKGAFVRAVKKGSRGKNSGGLPEIPFPEIKAQIDKAYPGKWPADVEFKDGCQGPAFWDPDATNPRSTVFRAHGVYCFSAEEKLFKPWKEILGADFTRKWEENKIGAATDGVYYQPKIGYYRKWPDGHWRSQNKEDLSLHLMCNQQLNRTKASNMGPSEIEMALMYVQQTRIIDGAVPFIFDKREVVEMAGQKYLNTSRVRPMEPDKSIPNPKFGDGFPWLAEFLWHMFAPRKQLVYLLAWLKTMYVGARQGNPRRGHAVFLVGGTNKGKTLLNAVIIPQIMGGGFDAGKYLLGREPFNKNMLEVGHWHIDDNMAAANKTEHTQFSEILKALIANPNIMYRPMYTDPIQIPFNGRIMISLNEDPNSLLMIPDLDMNNEDKVIVLRCSPDSPFRFPGQDQVKKILKAELKMLCHWLEEWTPPTWLVNPKYRLGMRNYIHEATRRDAAINSFDSDILGVLTILWDTDDELVSLRNQKQPWTGTAAELTALIVAHRNLAPTMSSLNVRAVGMRLNKLSKTKGSGVVVETKSKSKKHSVRYTIHPPSLHDD